MTPLFVVIAAILVVAQFSLPRRWAFAPLLIAVSQLPNLTMFELGAAVSISRLLILAGLLRAVCERQASWSLRDPLDRLMVVWACWAVLSSFGHSMTHAYNPVTVSLALACDYMGTYLYARAYLKDQADLVAFSKCLAISLLVLAVFMTVEKVTGRNLYGLVGGQTEAVIREGKLRAAGPFGNMILAGTFGGISLPLIILLWNKDRTLAILGAAGCLAVVVSSGSSGPVSTLIAAVAATALWLWRTRLRKVKVAAVLAILCLAMIMKAPIWYLIDRIDFTGSSTSWHRAELINQGIAHFNEWWLVGTDYTRHWLPYGIQWSDDHVDMTNHYLRMGVVGGVLLMLLFIAILLKCFQLLGRKIQTLRTAGDPAEFEFWCLGAALFAHCVSFLGVSYFDQNNVFLCLAIGAVPGLCAAPIETVEEPEPVLSDQEVFAPPPEQRPISVAGL